MRCKSGLPTIIYSKQINCSVVNLNYLEPSANPTICHRWVPVKTVNVPATAWFLDYADMGYRNGKLAIVSQVNSAMWNVLQR